jgi:hypothetical protein
MLALKIVRRALKLSIDEISALRKRQPDALITGTQTEMRWLWKLLSAEGLQATVGKLPGKSTPPSK